MHSPLQSVRRARVNEDAPDAGCQRAWYDSVRMSQRSFLSCRQARRLRLIADGLMYGRHPSLKVMQTPVPRRLPDPL